MYHNIENIDKVLGKIYNSVNTVAEAPIPTSIRHIYK